MSSPVSAPRRSAVSPAEITTFITAAVVLVTATIWTMSTPMWQGDFRDVRGFVAWTLQSVAEPQFYVAGAAGTGLVLGGWFAHLAHKGVRPWRGFLQACGTGIWPSVAGVSLLSLALSNVLFGWTLSGGMWQPLFVSLASVAPAITVLYGPGWKTSATAVVLGTVLAPPIALALVNLMCRPLGLPLVIGVTGGMAISAVPAFLLCRVLPWLPAPWAWMPTPREADGDRRSRRGLLWVVRRALADFSEAQFFGNEWASLAVIAGAVAAYLIAPATLSYGSGLFPVILAAQTLTAVAAVMIWRSRWERGFYPTFVPIVSTTPAAVLAFDGAWIPILVVVVLGVLIAPPLAAWISGRLPADFHPFIGNVASMAFSTLVLVPPVGLILGGIA